MPSMIPLNPNPDPGDKNRQIIYYKPGDPRPGVLLSGIVVFSLCSLLLLFYGVLFLTVQWDAPDTNQEYKEFVLRNMRYLGGISVIGGGVLAYFIPGTLRGKAQARKGIMVTSAIVMFFLLGGWVIGFSGASQPILAFFMAIGCLMVYRPSLKTYFHPDQYPEEE